MMRAWSGVSSVMMGAVPAHACYFSIYELSRRSFGIEANNDFYFLSTIVTGGLAVTAHDMIMTPMDVIKQRL